MDKFLVTGKKRLTSVIAPSTATVHAAKSKRPKESTINKWKNLFEWLQLTDQNTMICKVCVSQKEKNNPLKIRHLRWVLSTVLQISKNQPCKKKFNI